MAALRIALDRLDFGHVVAAVITMLGFALYAGAAIHGGF
jgi:hypothetical protein